MSILAVRVLIDKEGEMLGERGIYLVAVCGLWTVDCGLWTVDCGLWSVVCGWILSHNLGFRTNVITII